MLSSAQTSRKEGSTKIVLKSAVGNLESASGMVAAEPG